MIPSRSRFATDVLANAKSVLLIDWPGRDVPDTLARGGFTVVSHDGAGPDEYNAYEADGDEVRVRDVGRPPAQADLVYSHRPIDELDGIVEMATTVGAKAIWMQSGLDSSGAKDPRGCWMTYEDLERARSIVEGAGLTFIASPYIADAVRERSSSSLRPHP